MLVVAGDIAKRQIPAEHNKTAQLVEGIKPSHVFTVGDNQYDNGTLSEFQTYYDKTWGRFKNITKPTPGNDTEPTMSTSGASPSPTATGPFTRPSPPAARPISCKATSKRGKHAP